MTKYLLLLPVEVADGVDINEELEWIRDTLNLYGGDDYATYHMPAVVDPKTFDQVSDDTPE